MIYLENVKDLDKNTILSDEIFQELYRLDNVSRTKKLIELEDKAKELGKLQHFRQMLRAYEKVIKQDGRPSYMSDFTGAPEQFRTGLWQASDDEIFTLNERGKVIACKHPIYIDRLLKNAETGEYKVDIWFRRKLGGRWENVKVERKSISKASKITDLSTYGVDVTDNNAKPLMDYLSTLQSENNIFEGVSTSRLGWVGGNGYQSDDEALKSFFDTKTFMPYETDQVVFDAEKSLNGTYEAVATPKGSPDVWYALVRELRQTKRMEIFAYMAAALASVLVEPCGALPFVCDLWGSSGKGKTVALMLCCSIFADPNEGAYIATSRSTTTAEEIRLGVLNSLPLMIDDISQIKQSVPDVTPLIYQWCSGSSKSRSNIDLGLNKVYSWRNSILTNAEQSLVTETMQGGAINRIIDIEIGDKPIFEDAQKVASCVRQNYGWLGRDFIKEIQKIGMVELMDMCREKQETLKWYAQQQKTTKEEKQIAPMALMMVADEIIAKNIFKDNIMMNPATCVNMLKSIDQTSENKRAYNLLWETIAQHPEKFPKAKTDEYDWMNKPLPSREYGYETWGISNSDDSCDIIGKEFERILQEAGYQGKAFLSWAARNGVIQIEKPGQPKIQRKVNNRNVRCVRLLNKPEFLE